MDDAMREFDGAPGRSDDDDGGLASLRLDIEEVEAKVARLDRTAPRSKLGLRHA